MDTTKLKAVHIKEGEDMNDFILPTELSNTKTLADYDHLRVTKEKDIPPVRHTITIAGASIASPGNITGISAAAKAGKTALTGVMIAGAISQTGCVDGFTEIQVLPNIEEKAVIHFDTEQSEEDQQSFINTVLQRAGFNSTPEYYRSYNIRQLTLSDYRKTTDEICELSNDAFKGVHLIVIDGGADYIASANDEEKATEILQYFTHLSIKYKCPVLIIVHLNPIKDTSKGNEKERGHFGSILQRKCYGLLTISKNGDISTVQPKIMRKAGNGDIPLIHFTYSKDKGYHVQIDAPNNTDMKSKKEQDRIKEICAEVFAPPTALIHKEAVEKIMKHTGKKTSTAKAYLKDMEGWGFVSTGTDRRYRISETI